MAYDEKLASRIRTLFLNRNDVIEKKMFGGLAFMVSGHMCCGVEKNRLMARIGVEKYSSALQKPFVTEMNFTGKPLKGFVYIDADGLKTKKDLNRWIKQCVQFISSLPPK